MGVALAMACLALRTGDCAADVKQVIANKIIALAKGPGALCEKVLKDIRTEPACTGAFSHADARPPGPTLTSLRGLAGQREHAG
jgi:hypothetical protein